MSSTGEAEHRYNQYDTLGRVQDTRVVMRRADNQQKIQHTDIAYHGAPGTTDPSLGYDAAGNLRGQVQTTNGNTGDATRTTYKYQFNGSYQQTESTTTQGGTTATTNTWRDANGFISNIEQQGGVVDNRYNRAFVNDAQGNALYVNQSAGASNDKGSRIQNDPGGYIGGFIGDAINPGHIQRQLVANGEVLARYGDAPDSENPPQNGAVPKYVNTAEFHLDAPALKLRDTSFSAMSYTVVGGQTLKTIARNVLGDSSLWWRIAEANGLAVSGGGELKAGQTLSIPKLALNANNADTFQPYDPSRVTGSLDSVLPAPAGQGGGCGALGKIIMVAVAVAVTVFSGGFGSPVAAALGSIAGQATGNLLGVQDGFSWKSVALSALSAGLANNLPLPDLGSAWQNAAVRMGTVNALTQGIGVVTGLQDRFDWKSVAASAAGGAVGSYVGEQLKSSDLFKGWDTSAADLVRGSISGFAAGTATAVARGGRISIQQVATDAFGNALGSSLASMPTGTELQAQTNKGIYSLGGSGDGSTGLRLGSGEGLRYSDMRASSARDDFGPSPVERLEASGPDVIAQAYEHMQAFPQTSARFREVVDYYGSKAAYGNLPSLTPDATLVGFNSRTGEVWSTDANTFPVAEQSRLQATALAPLVTGWEGLRRSQSPADMIPIDGYSLVPSTQPERIGVIGQGLDLLERFERSPAGMMLQGLPPEGFILGVAKGGLNALGRLERIGDAGVVGVGSGLRISSNPATGSPAAIARGMGSLNTRQVAALEQLPDFGSQVILGKSFGQGDLAALTAHTGDEFAMFTTGGRRLVFRGNFESVPITPDKAAELANQGWRWSAHTHPGFDSNVLRSSPGDQAVLGAMGGNQSAIFNSLGQRGIFTPAGDSLNGWMPW